MPAWEYLSKIWPTMHLEVGSLCCCWQPLDLVSKVLVKEQNTNFSTGVLFSLVYCIWITSSTFLLVRRPPGGRVSSSFSPKKWRLSDLSLLRGFWASAMIISAKFIKILDDNNTNTQQRPAVQVRSEGVKLHFLEGGLKGNCKKKFIMEVKTRKSTERCKNPSKSTTIWNQTVSSITQAGNEIFQKFQSPE